MEKQNSNENQNQSNENLKKSGIKTSQKSGIFSIEIGSI